jgi:enoyl-CoA hydratase/carnithine racemase
MNNAFYECLEVESVSEGTIIRLNRPDRRNALSNKLIFELTEAVAAAAADPGVRVIVLAGSAQCFSAGADLSEAVSIDAAEFRPWNRRFSRLAEQIELAPQPVIAAISGYCFTGGLELALVCDVRIASDTATFAMTSARIGSVAGFGGTQRLPRLVGPSVAKRMMFRAEPIDAAEALRIGLVEAVVPVDELDAYVADEVVLYATRGPVSLAMTKRAVDNGLQVDLRSGLEIEADIVAQVFATDDKQEGMRAFLEKRSPHFRGM